MPIEIKELHVKIQVSDGKQKADPNPAQAMNELLETCLDEVFTVINHEKER